MSKSKSNPPGRPVLAFYTVDGINRLSHLRRNPAYLRVVVRDEVVICLDRLEDCPEKGDRIIGYKKVTEAVFCGEGEHSESAAHYEVVDVPEAIMRDNEQWRAWCLEQMKGKQ